MTAMPTGREKENFGSSQYRWCRTKK